MKKNLFTLLLVCGAYTLHAQSSAGLIAHWDMNGTVNDVTGNGHNGHASNITPAAGMDGVMGQAYYFNGVNSVITAPYMPDLNLPQYSICAIVNIQGFYTGTCQANAIFDRGLFFTTGNYMLYFTDNSYDGNDCLAIDSTKDVFCEVAGDCNAPFAAWQYSPQIIKNTWYKIVGTWDGTNYRIYVNDTLKSTVLSTSGAFGTSTDSISIGMQIFDPSYPYRFTGVIDDIRLYNRVLSDSEVHHYGDTCGVITLQPATLEITAGGTAVYTTSSTITGATYQWQQDAGTGFTNLTNAGPYSGVTTPTLTVTGATVSMNYYLYRCIVSNSWGCTDTTAQAILKTLGVIDQFPNNSYAVSVYPNPAHNELTLHSVYQPIQEVVITNLLGQTVFSDFYKTESAKIDISYLPAGVYLIKMNNTLVKKFVKD